MEIYTLPSAIALVIKIWLIVHTWRVLLVKNKELGLFLVALFFLNLCELIGFAFYFDDISHARPIMLLYYTALFFTVTSFVNLSSCISGFRFFYRPRLYYSSVCLLAVLLFGSDLLIAGVQSIDYSATRIAGKYYWIIQIYVVTGFFLPLILLGLGVIRQGERFLRRRCLIVLIGFLPTALAFISVAVLMQLGYRVNATITVSFTISFFLIFHNRMIVMGDKAAQFKLLRQVPFTEERRQFKASHALVIETLTQAHYQQPMQLKEKLHQLEEQIIELAVHTSDGNQARAAEQLGISKSNLNRKIKSKAGQQSSLNSM